MINYLKKAIFILLTTVSIMFLTTLCSNAATKLTKPTDVKVSISKEKDIKVTWTQVEGASKYTVYRATSKKGTYKKIGTTKTTSFKSKGLTRGKTYYFKVTAISGKLSSKQSKSVKATVPTTKKALKEIKKALKNAAWIKSNIKDKTDGLNYIEGENYSHKIYFEKIKNKELVVIRDFSEDAFGYQIFVVGYYNGKVTAKKMFDYGAHPYNSGVSIDLKNGIASFGYLHMGYETNIFYKISPVKFIQKDYLYTNVMAEEYPIIYKVNNKNVSKNKYNNVIKKYNKYSFKGINKKLSSKNIDKYIK